MSSEKKPRLILFGGFLGSGKTTLIMEVGRLLTDRDYSVAIVTNDQGEDLVDTRYAQLRGFAVGEVIDGCFCCNFSEFVSNITEITTRVQPDFVLAEPVGSCTDLVATVIGPLSLYHEALVELGPYLVLADGPRLCGEYRSLNLIHPVSPREVLIAHQIRETRSLILTKSDLLSAEQMQFARSSLAELNGDAEILECSAREGTGVDAVVEAICAPGSSTRPNSIPIDYEVYAAAEAEMGWYNGIAMIRAETESIDPEGLALDLADEIRNRLGVNVIHGKAMITSELGGIKISVVAGSISADTTIDTVSEIRAVGLTLNLRATLDPEELGIRAREILDHVAKKHSARLGDYQYRSLTPGTPVPEHRIGT